MASTSGMFGHEHVQAQEPPWLDNDDVNEPDVHQHDQDDHAHAHLHEVDMSRGRLYGVLNLESDCTQDDIVKAYKRLAGTSHLVQSLHRRECVDLSSQPCYILTVIRTRASSKQQMPAFNSSTRRSRS